MRQREDIFKRGYPRSQMGQLVAAASSVALPLTLTTEWLFLRPLIGNTDTIWMGTASNTTSLTGFPIQSATSFELPIQAGSLSLFFQSQGGSSVISYIALGF